MQHDHVLKKNDFLPIEPIPRVGVGVGGGYEGKIFGNLVAAIVILLNLICNMAMFLEN